MARCVLFLPLHAPSLLEMIPVASKVAADGKYQALFFLNGQNRFREEHICLLRKAGLSVIGTDATSDSRWNRSQMHTRKQSLAFLKKCIRRAIPTTLLQTLYSVVAYVAMIRGADAMLEREAAAALVLMGDRHVGWETALIRAANRRGIPSLIVPFALSAPESDVKYRLDGEDVDWRYGMQRLSNRLAGTFFHNWVYEYKGRRLLFVPGPRAVMAWALGTMPENPWALGGGAATRMAVESSHYRCMLIEQGVSEEKLVVTGKPSVDQMHEALQRTSHVRKELDIPETDHILLCALPPLAEISVMRWPQHWQEIEFLLATFARLKNLFVVLSLHPRCNPSDYQHLADRYGAILAKQRIYGLLPACDVFVATYSSTVMQAIGIGKPTVVVDFYGLDYKYYDNAPGVIVLRSRDQLESTLARLFSDPQHYNQLAAAQRQHSSEWILLDGKSTERVVKELYQLIENHDRNRLT